MTIPHPPSLGGRPLAEPESPLASPLGRQGGKHAYTSRDLWFFVTIPLIVISAVIGGGVIVWFAVNGGFPLGELERVRAVHRFYLSLEGKEAAQVRRNVFFLGNSVTREGIDATVFENAADRPLDAYNLGITGASLEEMALQVAHLKRVDAREVFVLVEPAHFDSRSLTINESKLVLYKLLGFNLEETPPVIAQRDQEYLSSWVPLKVLDARFVFRRATEDWVRMRVRGDLNRNDQEFKNPSMYTQHQPIDKIRVVLQRTGISQREFIPVPGHTAVLRYIIGNLADAGVRVTVVAVPQHELVVELVGQDYIDEYTRWLRDLAESERARYVDATNLLRADEFIDHNHPSVEGRAKLSRILAKGD